MQDVPAVLAVRIALPTEQVRVGSSAAGKPRWPPMPDYTESCSRAFLRRRYWRRVQPVPEELDGKNIEQIIVQGLRKVPEATVLRQMKSKVGEPHSASNVAKDRERLDRMAVFSKIAIDARASTNGVILREDLKETLSYLPYPAIGVTGEQGVTFGLGLKSTNFLSSGANLAAAARFGGANEIEFLANSAWRPYTVLVVENRILPA